MVVECFGRRSGFLLDFGHFSGEKLAIQVGWLVAVSLGYFWNQHTALPGGKNPKLGRKFGIQKKKLVGNSKMIHILGFSKKGFKKSELEKSLENSNIFFETHPV